MHVSKSKGGYMKSIFSLLYMNTAVLIMKDELNSCKGCRADYVSPDVNCTYSFSHSNSKNGTDVI